MSTTETITLADGRRAVITGAFSEASGENAITFQITDAAGNPVGGPQLLTHEHGLGIAAGSFSSFNFDSSHFIAVPLSDGGFEVAFNSTSSNLDGFFFENLTGFEVGPSGVVANPPVGALAIGPANVLLSTMDNGGEKFGFGSIIQPRLFELDGGRFALAYQHDDSNGVATAHVALGNATGLYADVSVDGQPDTVTHANGDISLTWTVAGSTFREVLAEDGTVLAAKGVSHQFAVGVSDGAFLSGFDAAHDQLTLTNPDGSVAGGATSTLTFNAANHTLTWDPDSEGPAPATTAAVLGVDKLTVANLADGFRPAVLKVIAADGSSDITWFDTANAQTWDTLHATEDAKGDVLTYGSTADTGTQEVFTFDATNTQAYTRYVDEIDPGGHVTQRTVLYDDGTSWTAKFALSGGQVVSYELDSFDAAGHQIGQSFFNADGTPLAH